MVVHDDLLATAGTTVATINVVEQLGGQVVGCCYLIELAFLGGRERLAGHDVQALINYESPDG